MLGNALIRGEKVYLGPIRREHILIYTTWFQDLEFLQLLGKGALMQFTEQDETEWYERQSKSTADYQFAIYTCDDDNVIGTTALQSIHWRNRMAMFGIAIGDKNYWGKGYGREATRLMLRFGFIELNLHRIWLQVFAFNTRAIRAYEQVGFVHEVRLRESIYRDGRYHDIYQMSILRDEWNDNAWE